MVTTTTNGISAADIFASLNPKAQGAVKGAQDEAQDRFLKLYVTQLKNQDPLNPLDNAQVTSQLAQLNTVKGIESLNATLNKLVEFFAGGQAMQAAAMIGKDVLVPGVQMLLRDGLAGAGFELQQAADKVVIKIADGNGLTMRTLDLGARQSGSAAFAWDGLTDAGAAAVDGNYKFSVNASSGGKPVASTALEFGTVSAVIRANGGFELDLGRAGSVRIDDVRRIL